MTMANGPLRVGADGVGHRGGKQPQSRNQHRHHDGAKPQDSAFDRGSFRSVTSGSKLIDVFEHDDTRLNRDAEERQEADTGRNAEECACHEESEQPPVGAMATLRIISSAHLKERNMV